MEVIEEQTKCEMDISPPIIDNIRICLVGDVVNDAELVEVARSFNVPVLTSENGLELINDNDWRTYFILSEFEGPTFEAIHENKQCILGPPALKHIAKNNYGLKRKRHYSRPIYNYSMEGVKACFEGIRKKVELTQLVDLIHSMGGSIRKEIIYTEVEHLITVRTGGKKYNYAKTFRVNVLRPSWILAAWEQRNDLNFRATNEEFSKEHRLKAFEGQKICFFGFPPEEHEHMVDVLKANGGLPCELDDPECTHVVMPNTGACLPEEKFNNSDISNICNTTNISKSPINSTNNPNPNPIELMEVDTETTETVLPETDKKIVQTEQNTSNEENEVNKDNKLINEEINNDKCNVDIHNSDDSEIDEQFAEKLAVDVEYQKELENEADDFLLNDLFVEDNEFDFNDNAKASTPVKETHPDKKDNAIKTSSSKHDMSFENPNNISPILNEQITPPNIQIDKASTFAGNLNNISPILNEEITPPDIQIDKVPTLAANPNNILPILNEHILPGTEVDKALIFPETPRVLLDDIPLDENEQFETDNLNDLKRKRECFDNISLLSVESFAMPNSTKKPKLVRTGSITRCIKRSLSFAAARTPITRMLRPRRSSVAHEITTDLHEHDDISIADNSFSSITSVDSSIFNESFYKPVKQKLSNLRQRITRSSSKKDKDRDKSILGTPEKKSEWEQQPDDAFKTPKAPAKISISAAVAAAVKVSTPKSLKKSKNSSSMKSSSSNTNQMSDKVHMVQDASITCTDVDNNNFTTNPTNIPMHLKCNKDISNTVTGIGTATATDVASLQPAASYTTLENETKVQNDKREPNTVVDEHTVQAKPEPKSQYTYILKSDWFWYTIQMGFARESDYLFGNYLNSIANTPNTDRRESLPISFNKRKRRLFSQRQHPESTPRGSGKRRSSISEAGLLSVSNSFFDCTASPDKLESGKLYNESESSTCELTTPSKKSMRFNHFMDFYNTESNYVGILDTIVNLFKIPLELSAEQAEPLINKSEIRAIFGNFLPIHEVHQRMLERLRSIQSKWSEDCSIGDIILQHRDDLIKAYPPYVNFFEKMVETLQQCDNQYARFHAFLKINQAKPECGRQSLQDLMIRPVQRLPSISLLLNDILKHTNKNNPDFERLEESLKAIKEVMTHINEDKRKTESRMAIFDIFNEIDGCPAHLVSSNRSFICKCEVTELSDSLSGRGDSLMLYLFSDTIEVSKKRSRGFNSAKSPSATHKSHKHIKLIPLNAIRFVIDIIDSSRAFALLCRHDKDKLHSFTIADEEIDKCVYLKKLCKQMAENACRTDTEKSLLCRTSEDLQIDISDVNLSTLSKAFKLAARTRLKKIFH
ncbi:protein ECT2 isoform X2 [Teleopsis dalmanni]|uniref:protein ECT2 isoform X2 n=1 Tax=Teleopsis dalmanni TaxID=139649 RepID=UPI0018CFA613|nr:protein ECT2 isoform X2 [Teleopsis dalmanni]